MTVTRRGRHGSRHESWSSILQLTILNQNQGAESEVGVGLVLRFSKCPHHWLTYTSKARPPKPPWTMSTTGNQVFKSISIWELGALLSFKSLLAATGIDQDRLKGNSSSWIIISILAGLEIWRVLRQPQKLQHFYNNGCHSTGQGSLLAFVILNIHQFDILKNITVFLDIDESILNQEAESIYCTISTHHKQTWK